MPYKWDDKFYFTVVREPAEWLASVWAHRVRERWNPYPQKIPWQQFCFMLQPFQINRFPAFIDAIAEHRPGIVGWLYGTYCPPWATPFRIEDQIYPWLRDHGYDPDEQEPVNIGPNRKKAVVTPEIRDKVQKAEIDAYWRYGYLSVDNP
jgi:hypothetical protein